MHDFKFSDVDENEENPKAAKRTVLSSTWTEISLQREILIENWNYCKWYQFTGDSVSGSPVGCSTGTDDELWGIQNLWKSINNLRRNYCCCCTQLQIDLSTTQSDNRLVVDDRDVGRLLLFSFMLDDCFEIAARNLLPVKRPWKYKLSKNITTDCFFFILFYLTIVDVL